MVSVVAALLVASMGVTAAAARCATCAEAPCCAVKDATQAHLMPKMPCCAASTGRGQLARTVVAADEPPVLLPVVQRPTVIAVALPVRVPGAGGVAPPSARRLYQTKCARLL